VDADVRCVDALDALGVAAPDALGVAAPEEEDVDVWRG
jgi:hypothetical protein